MQQTRSARGRQTSHVGQFEQFPPAAAWRHTDARQGFEVAFFAPKANGWRMTGRTSAVEDGIAWSVGYVIDVDGSWSTRRAAIDVMTADGTRHIELTGDGDGHWHLDGQPVPHVTGCLDVDLESSSMTNTLPVHRLTARSGAEMSAPAVYVRATDLSVERLEQTYRRGPDTGAGSSFDYAAPRFDTRCRLVYDGAGLVTVYPGIAERVF
jgi:hypothetical protein